MRFFRKKSRCESCARAFATQEELMQHQQVMHGKNLPYDCKVCNQNFASMEEMRTHLQRQHSYRN